MTAFLSGLLFFIFVVDVLLLIPVVLMQSGSGAQAGLFGSDFAAGAFGAKTSEVLVSFTKWLVAIFFISSLGLAYLHLPRTPKVPPAVTSTEQAPAAETPAPLPAENTLPPQQ
ncbi:preprotein translocase subunit SecG [Thermospira aquatica]|uniref:Protein-export membrane protein SecG n=1 Tax=Thermospira aquatica TaxID=2828656 RepID=A0AAX3BCD9_9SPIR|nr:preprotein translocase subunit SecG [Thermospira aquatica]URA09859.1 preprotein translocase subunit SecG [Thermospira aquatica]